MFVAQTQSTNKGVQNPESKVDSFGRRKNWTLNSDIDKLDMEMRVTDRRARRDGRGISLQRLRRSRTRELSLAIELFRVRDLDLPFLILSLRDLIWERRACDCNSLPARNCFVNGGRMVGGS